MEDSTQHNDEQIQDSTVQPVATLGSTLRVARERLGLSVHDVANQIKFAPRQIEALEADDFSARPEATFLRGFVRSYGRLLHLDEAMLFALLPETKVNMLSADPAPNEMSFSTAHAARRPNLVWMSGALVVVAIALGFAITNVKSPAKSSEPAAVETAVALPGDMAVMAEQPVEQVTAQATSAIVSVAPTLEIAPSTVVKTDVKVEPKQAEVKIEVKKTEVKAGAKQSEANTAVAPPVATKKLVVTTEKPKSLPAAKSIEKPVPVREVAPVKETIPIDTLLGTQPAKPVSEPATSSEAELDGASLRIEFGEESWAEIRDKNGKSLSSKINASGSELNLKGKPPYTLTISHAKSARLFYKGKQVDLTRHINKFSTSEVANLTLE